MKNKKDETWETIEEIKLPSLNRIPKEQKDGFFKEQIAQDPILCKIWKYTYTKPEDVSLRNKTNITLDNRNHFEKRYRQLEEKHGTRGQTFKSCKDFRQDFHIVKEADIGKRQGHKGSISEIRDYLSTVIYKENNYIKEEISPRFMDKIGHYYWINRIIKGKNGEKVIEYEVRFLSKINNKKAEKSFWERYVVNLIQQYSDCPALYETVLSPTSKHIEYRAKLSYGDLNDFEVVYDDLLPIYDKYKGLLINQINQVVTKTGLDRKDIEQVAYSGIQNALKKYNENLGKLSSYISKGVFLEIKTFINSQGTQQDGKKIFKNKLERISQSEVIKWDENGNEKDAEYSDDGKTSEKMMNELITKNLIECLDNVQERKILEMQYKGYTREKIAKKLGKSPARIDQLWRQIKEKIKKKEL